MQEETSVDSDVFNSGAASSNGQDVANNNEIQTVSPASIFEKSKLYYDMNGEKLLIIFNHHTYKKTKYFKYAQPPTRIGSFEDVKKLKEIFKSLNFKVKVYHDLCHVDIINRVSEICDTDHSKTSCICVVILTHGDRAGELYAADRPYRLKDVMSMFEGGHQTLVAKPKLFFIQACRGGQTDAGRMVQLDGTPVAHIPIHADFLVLYSCVEDHISFKSAKGSWMIQALCKVLEDHHENLDILHMITLVNRMVAYDKVSFAPNHNEYHNKKQMTEARFTLTKLFKFH